jgi:hypothetical protein
MEQTSDSARPSNVIPKWVTPTRDWQHTVEVHAMNGVCFVVRPFKKADHWPFLEELCERFDLTPRFDACDRSAYFMPAAWKHSANADAM